MAGAELLAEALEGFPKCVLLSFRADLAKKRNTQNQLLTAR
nr:MAG TPA: hypothetical protein [Caudoviricetes sp.]